MYVKTRFVWCGANIREKLGLKSGYLDMFSFVFGKMIMNSKIIIFFNLVPKPLELCNGAFNQS